MTRTTGRWLLGALGIALALEAACGGGSSGGSGGPPPVGVEPAFGGLVFSRPVKLLQHPDDDDRWYVVEQGGLVHTFLASDPGGTVAVAADVDALVDLGGGEQGLLGMAFDPDFHRSGEVYLAYTDEAADDSVLARWESFDGGLTFVPAAAPIVLAIPHPRENHNGGDLAFGPDGFLYYTLGDGGGSGDPDENAQDTTTLLGSILRLDVTSTPPLGRTYAIPAGNPFSASPHCDTGTGALSCPEIFAWGLRNPWRFHFDPDTGRLWAGDVGQARQEEIDRIELGANYGWDCVEGELDFEPDAACDAATLTPPEVVHGRSDAKAITGGAVYRGSAIPGLAGHYVYGDFVTGMFFTFDTDRPDGAVTRLGLPAINVAAFGQGRDGEIYIVGFGSPSIHRLIGAGG